MHTQSTLFPYTTLFRSKRFVEKNKRRLQRKRPRNLQPAALSAGERVRLASSHRFETHLHQELLQPVALLFRRQRKRFQHGEDRKSTRLNSSHQIISYAV